jgi:Zn-dependent alcohol dehydrogenase
MRSRDSMAAERMAVTVWRSRGKALVLNALGRGFDFEDVDIAMPVGSEVLVDVKASGLCHTDLLFATHDSRLFLLCI